MTIPDSEEALRKSIARLGTRGRGLRYPHDLRVRVVAHARERAERGESTASVANSLGLVPATLTLWLRAAAASPEDGGAFRAVVVAEAASGARGRGIVVETRGGLRASGLDVAQLVELVRSLG